VFICAGIQGYLSFVGNLVRAGALEWPIRLLLMVGGVLLATPSGPLLPWSGQQMLIMAAAMLLLAVGAAFVRVRRV
jgi:low affinity Fe/Cu permease